MHILRELSSGLSRRHYDIVGRYAGKVKFWCRRFVRRPRRLGRRRVDHVTVGFRKARLDGRHCCRRGGRQAWV